MNGEPRDGFRWSERLDKSWDLGCPYGCCAGTVWRNGCWTTWDEDGTGGENGEQAHDVERAKLEVAAALLRQGWHHHRRRRASRTVAGHTGGKVGP